MTEQERIIEMLKHLDLSPCDDSYTAYQKLVEYDRTLSEFVKVSDGASKICFIFTEKPFVVKWSTDNYGEAMKEVEVYQKAVEQNLEKFFPKTAFLVRVNSIDFVVQEKIDTAASHCGRRERNNYRRIAKTATDKIVFKIEKEFCKAGDGYHRSLDHDWAKLAIVLYGKKACKALCDFVIENKINDLHGNNIGYKNNRPIILDFSGYYR